jgi:transcriptional regulator with XRE-family HTH domain
MSVILFALAEMSLDDAAGALSRRLAAHVGVVIGDARTARRQTLRELADRAGVAASSLHAIEHGQPGRLETYAAIARALDLDLRLDLVDPRRRAPTSRPEDPVHSAMGEVLAERLRRHGFEVGIDEPYQHYQFAGRADVIAWDVGARALLHVENRTRFPNLQDAAGAWNAKRQYLAAGVARRLGLRSGFDVVTHVMAGLWSAEVLHAIRIRPASFRALCPGVVDDFREWWAGRLPDPGPPTSSFILLDPVADDFPRRRPFVELAATDAASLRPRYAGYREAAEALRRTGRV